MSNQSPSEGMYIGLSGGTKRTWELLLNKSIGVVYAGFGKYLYDTFGHNETDEKLIRIHQLAAALKEEVDRHEHSGASIMVEMQQLMDLMGARCLDDTTRNYVLNIKPFEK